jgi:hypothetical protein
MSTSFRWRPYILLTIFAVISASCGEAGRESAQDRTTANLGSAPNTQVSPTPPVNDPLTCHFLREEYLRLEAEYARLRQSANKNPSDQNLRRELAIAEAKLLEIVQRSNVANVAKMKCETKMMANAPATGAANSRKIACPATRLRELEFQLQDLLQKFTEQHPDVIALQEQIQACTAQPQLRSGKWVEQDGALVCDGYLTRSADQDYCSALPPEDWVPFTFEGQTYYVQPLGSSAVN